MDEQPTTRDLMKAYYAPRKARVRRDFRNVAEFWTRDEAAAYQDVFAAKNPGTVVRIKYLFGSWAVQIGVER